jgi:membrane fusion protein, multidrug efflux system
MKKIIWIIVIVIVIIAAAIRLKESHDTINKSNTNSGIPSVVNVNVAPVEERDAGRILNLTGTLYPKSKLNIAAQAQGQITSVSFELGQEKTKGEVIATIDSKLKQLAVDNAMINESKLKRDYERSLNLYNGGSATEQQLDETRHAYESAKIQLEQAKKQLADAFIIVPGSGVIAEKFVEEGDYINPGSPIATLINISKLKIRINASEANVYQLQKGDKVIVTTEIYPGIQFSGIITFVSDKGDDSHNYPVEAEMDNSKQNPLKAGTFVNVKINDVAHVKGLFIPREALVGSTQDASVYTVKNGKAVLQKISVLSNGGVYLQVLSGLTKDEKVIVTGQINLVDGQPVNIVEI